MLMCFSVSVFVCCQEIEKLAQHGSQVNGGGVRGRGGGGGGGGNTKVAFAITLFQASFFSFRFFFTVCPPKTPTNTKNK